MRIPPVRDFAAAVDASRHSNGAPRRLKQSLEVAETPQRKPPSTCCVSSRLGSETRSPKRLTSPQFAMTSKEYG